MIWFMPIIPALWSRDGRITLSVRLLCLPRELQINQDYLVIFCCQKEGWVKCSCLCVWLFVIKQVTKDWGEYRQNFCPYHAVLSKRKGCDVGDGIPEF